MITMHLLFVIGTDLENHIRHICNKVIRMDLYCGAKMPERLKAYNRHATLKDKLCQASYVWVVSELLCNALHA
jgi:hypothetical protein